MELECAMYTNCLLLGLDPSIIGIGGSNGTPRVGLFRHSNPRMGEQLLYFILSAIMVVGGLGRLKLADFGWSVQSRSKRLTMCGTLDYLAPEMVTNKAHDYTVDNWTLGILCYEFLYGVPPFEAESQEDTFKRILEIDLSFPPTAHVSAEAKDLICRLLVKDSLKRLSLEKILDHPWIIRNADPSGACIEKGNESK